MEERTTLTYQGATFKRTLIYLAIAIASALAFIFLKFKPQVPSPGTVAGPPLEKIVLGAIIVGAFFSAISDAFFVVDFKFSQKRIECDRDNLYITRKNGMATIPFLAINRLRLSSTGMNKSIRGVFSIYVIEYKDTNGRPQETDISVYRKMMKNFELFRQWLKETNPTVEIKNWSTSLDGLFRLFKKRT